MRLTLFSLLIAASLLAACNNGEKAADTKTASTAAPQPAAPKEPESDLTKEQTGTMMNMLAAYYTLKDALVATDGAKANDAAAKLKSEAEGFDKNMGDQPQYTEMQPKLKTIITGSNAIAHTGAEATEEKRKHFSEVSDAMFSILKKANLRHAGVYQEFCPMAFNDKGAYWLSAESDIKNPYFGKKMLECGEVKDSL
jgi:Cu(I)/Ag(I) efflux system membrane fusion protein